MTELEILGHNPLTTPDWRRQYVLDTLRPGRRRPHSPDETRLIRRYRRFLQQLERAADDAVQQENVYDLFDDVGDAHRLFHAADQNDRRQLEAWLLSGLSNSDAAIRTGLSVPTVTAFEHLFFDIQRRLQAHVWVYMHLLRRPPGDPADGDGRLSDASRWRLYRKIAYYGGPIALEAVMVHFPPAGVPQHRSDFTTAGDELEQAIRVCALLMMMDSPFETPGLPLIRLALRVVRQRPVTTDSERRIGDERVARCIESLMAEMNGRAPTESNGRAGVPRELGPDGHRGDE